jgi:beta-lactamase class A
VSPAVADPAPIPAGAERAELPARTFTDHPDSTAVSTSTVTRSTRGEDGRRQTVHAIGEEAGARVVAVAFHDYETDTTWSLHGGEWFHAASTIKVPVLLGVFGAIHAGELEPESRVHVRNRFLSAADGTPYRVGSGRDANAEVHQEIGRTMRISELARHMIVTSSNLATNLLVDVVGIDRIRKTLQDLSLSDGIELRRGVEDERAFDRGINNRVTADGLLRVLRVMEERRAFTPDASERMLDILHAQEFRSGIPAGVPADARVANKTGEISTEAHDAGIVYLADRAPYALVVLTSWERESTSGRRDAIARISRAVFERLTGAEDG